MSEEDLERYEAEIELALVQEYRAVLPMFNYVVETERRFYLANEVEVTVREGTTPACVELELDDAWVWDMYRPARFVPSVRVLTFQDVNVERLPEQELMAAPTAAGPSARARRGPGGGLVRVPGLRGPRPQLALRREGELDLVVRQRAHGGLLRGEDPDRRRLRLRLEAVVAGQAAPAPPLAARGSPS